VTAGAYSDSSIEMIWFAFGQTISSLPLRFGSTSGIVPPETLRISSPAFAAPTSTSVYVHRVGDDQEGFFAFYEREVLPAFR
jgi:hypothetical protein